MLSGGWFLGVRLMGALREMWDRYEASLTCSWQGGLEGCGMGWGVLLRGHGGHPVWTDASLLGGGGKTFARAGGVGVMGPTLDKHLLMAKKPAWARGSVVGREFVETCVSIRGRLWIFMAW